MRWIPVSERLPEPGERVLVTWGVMAGEAYHNGRDWIRNECYLQECFGYTVTHWMPLPEPPQEKKPLRIYIAAPYSAPTEAERLANTYRAIDAATTVYRKGHVPFVPHLCHWWDARLTKTGDAFTWENWMAIDDAWLTQCDAILYLAPSRGADIELARAKEMGLRIFCSVEEVPDER